MLIQCPHCYKNILPRGDDSCPSCDGDTNDEKALSNPFRPVVFPIPIPEDPLCILCGSPSTELKVVIEKHRDDDALARNLFKVIFSVLTFGAGGTTDREHVQHEVAASVPLCDHCARFGNIDVHEVRYDRQSIAIMCHHAFRESIETEN